MLFHTVCYDEQNIISNDYFAATEVFHANTRPINSWKERQRKKNNWH